MRSLAWHPEDARWLRGWLRSHFVCAVAISAFLLLVHRQPHRSDPLKAQSSPLGRLDRLSPGRASTGSKRVPPLSDVASMLPPSGRARSVAPAGWRRTDRGWENVATWRPSARPLGEIVMQQEAREPNWMKSAMARLRQLPPLAFAMLQIAAISAIVAFSQRDGRGETGRRVTSAGRFVRHRRSAAR